MSRIVLATLLVASIINTQMTLSNACEGTVHGTCSGYCRGTSTCIGSGTSCFCTPTNKTINDFDTDYQYYTYQIQINFNYLRSSIAKQLKCTEFDITGRVNNRINDTVYVIMERRDKSGGKFMMTPFYF